MNWKRLSSVLIVVLLLTAAVAILVNHFHIPDFAVIKPDVLYTSGQPRGMDYTRLLYKYHIGTIVNVRLSSEHRNHNWYHEEMSWAKDNSVNLVEIPIVKANYFPNEDTQKKFLEVMSNKGNLPVLLHGSTDDKRVAMLTAVWLRKALNYSDEETIDEIKKIIDDRNLTEAEVQFISSLSK